MASIPNPSDGSVPLAYKPPLVIAVHGIRTHAPWFDTLADVLRHEGIDFKFHRYGFFRLWRMMLGPKRENALENFVNFYDKLIADFSEKGVDPNDSTKRPSIIAHSFGSYLVGYSLLKYDYLKFDKIILCGSILPRDFPWVTLLARGQVDHVYDDFGGRDFWCSVVGYCVPGKTGASGRTGFATRSKMVQQHENPLLRHSDYFKRERIRETWIPVLKKPPSDLRILHSVEIESRTAYELILRKKIDEVDSDCFKPLPGYEIVAPPLDLLLSWIETEPDIYTFLVNSDGKLAGYLDAIPVTDDFFRKVAAGEKKENDIRPEHMVPYTDDAAVKLYVTSLALANRVRLNRLGLYSEPLERLMNGFLIKLIQLARLKKVRVTDVVAEGWTSAGQNWCEFFGMTSEKKDAMGHPIYCLSMNDTSLSRASKRFELVAELLVTYRDLGWLQANPPEGK